MCSTPPNGCSNSRIISTAPATAIAHKTKVKPDIKLRAQTAQNWRTAGTARTRREQRTPLECPAQPLGPDASAYYRSLRHAIAPAVETIDDGDRAVATRALNTRPA